MSHHSALHSCKIARLPDVQNRGGRSEGAAGRCTLVKELGLVCTPPLCTLYCTQSTKQSTQQDAHSPGCRAHITRCTGQSALHRAQLGLVHRSRQALPFSHPAGAACTVVHQTSPHHRILPLRPTMPHLASSWTPLPLESNYNLHICMSYMGQYKANNEKLC